MQSRAFLCMHYSRDIISFKSICRDAVENYSVSSGANRCGQCDASVYRTTYIIRGIFLRSKGQNVSWHLKSIQIFIFWPDIIGNKLRKMAGSEKQFVLICVDGSENSEFAFECKLPILN